MRGLVLLLILSTGCLIVPKATTETRVVGTHTKVVPLAAGALAVRAQSQDAVVRVFAAHQFPQATALRASGVAVSTRTGSGPHFVIVSAPACHAVR